MALLFFSEDYEKLYNCYMYDYKSLPYEARSSPFRGWIYLSTFFVVWALYVPCIIAMCDRTLLQYSCYKLMLFLAILDLHTSLYTGFWAGLLSITGNVFCSWPTFAYWIGCLNTSAWMTQAPATVLLAFNRCVEAFDEKLADKLFQSWRIYLWMFIPLALGARDFCIGSAAIYNPIFSVIMYDPHGGYQFNTTHVYENKSVYYNNTICAIFVVIMYATLGILIYLKTRDASMITLGRKTLWRPEEMVETPLQYENKSVYYNNTICAIFVVIMYATLGILIYLKTRDASMITLGRKTKVFGQCFLIAAFLFGVSAGYLLIQRWTYVPALFYDILQYTFLLFNGLPAVIYLIFNSTIRRKVKNMLTFQKSSSTPVISLISNSSSVGVRNK